MLGLQSLFPILKWGSEYNFTKFKGDLIAGLTIASLCIPQDIGYSKLANLDPQYGLYSSFVPPLVYAVMGSSRDIAIGPVAVVSLLLGSLLQDEFDPKTNKEEYRRLAFTATFLQIGFSSGLSISCRNCWIHGWNSNHNRPSTAKGFLGIQNFTKKTDIISVMKSVWGSVHHGWNWETIVIGTAFLAFLMLAKYIMLKCRVRKNRTLFWVPAIAPLISVILSTFFVYITHAEKKGVQIVREIKKGINPSSIHQIYFSGSNLAKGIKIGVISGMIALTEAVAIGRTFSDLRTISWMETKKWLPLGR
ncbi:hypothetical protein HPP92_004061 [Vanilla planifolia]|uniref:SLC26A/SulP transporter domain-containing protein n=1 Tax=Vanilla planifolia TaxID=51239 RepID=A0A835RVL9_VANPL|nr:hypothetical protein HPP92_004061 [Vanilla planifolia]